MIKTKLFSWLFSTVLVTSHFVGTWQYNSQKYFEITIQTASACTSQTRNGEEIGCYTREGYLELFYPQTGNYILKGVMALRGELLEVTYENNSPNVPPQDRFRRYYLEPL